MKVISLIVTFNRLQLLKKSIESLEKQKIKLEKIIIVNNNSTDGTKEYLETLDNKFYDVINLNQNIGGAGGFSKGILESFAYDYDWIWIMDDDTIVTETSLEEMLKISKIDKNIGFLCSKVMWNKTEIHKMNLPVLSSIINNEVFNKFENNLLVKSCSFVSVLIKKEVIEKIGLPYKEFFIWYDDAEYTNRIVKKNYYGIYVPSSIVYHETVLNYSVNMFEDSGKNDWKYYYGIRNELFVLKKENKVKYILKLGYNLIVLPIKIRKLRKDKKVKYICSVLKATIESILFNPKIEYIYEKEIIEE